MEKLVIEKENLDIDVNKLLEEIQTKDYFKSDNNNSVDVIVLKINNPSFKLIDKNSYDVKLLGKSMINWVKDAVEGYNVIEIECDIDSSIIDICKNHLKDSKYTAILYCDTPLLTKSTFEDIITYVVGKELKVCKLMRGFVFDTEYLKTTDKFYSINTYSFNEQEFMPAVNFIEISKITAILQTRINNFHLSNGVQIIKPETCIIETDVAIGNNVVINPNCNLLGESAIGNNVIVGPGTSIIDSVIFENSVINNSIIEKSVIKENCLVEPFCNICNNSLINANNKIQSFSYLNRKELN